MKLGLAFDGSSTLCSAHTQIQSIQAGKAMWLLEYTTIDFEERFVIQRLLKEKHSYGMRHYRSESFPAYTAGKFHFLNYVTVL